MQNNNNISLECLVESLKENFNEENFVQLFNKFEPLFRKSEKVYNIPGFTQEEYYQEGRIALLNAISNYKVEKAAFFASYFKMVYKNQLLNIIRKQTAVKRGGNKIEVSIDQLCESDYTGRARVEEILEDRLGSNPEDLAVVKEAEDLFFKHLSKLEIEVMRRYLKAYSFDEIAEELGQSKDRVCNAYDRCRQKMRHLF